MHNIVIRVAFALVLAATAATGQDSSRQRVRVIYSTDLFHPPDDPDDHLDLATAFALKELDIRAVLLDQGDKQQRRSGRTPLEQMMALTGRRVPYAVGLGQKLELPSDDGRNQPREYQAAVELLLSTLRESRAPVALIATGSLRDVTAAFNREPQLMRSRLRGVYVNAGHAKAGGGEYNVELDPHAFRGLLASGLPIYWFPCWPANDRRSAHWRLARYSDVFEVAPARLQNFFLYALHRVDPAEINPVAALDMNLRPWRNLVWGAPKDMWSTASLLTVAGRIGGWQFVPARLEVDGAGKTSVLSYSPAGANVRALDIKDVTQYPAEMTRALQQLFSGFPVAK